MKVFFLGAYSAAGMQGMSMEEKFKDIFDWYKIITIMEKTLLVIIAFLTTYAVVFEILSVV